MKYKSASTYLILLATVLFCLGTVMAIFVYRTVENLKDDARIINHAGVVRGSIQRLTKLELSDPVQSNEELIGKIDNLIENFFLMDEGYKAGGSGKELVKRIRDLKGKWESLKESLVEYRFNRSEHIRKQVILKSEICWKTADAAVLTAQLATEDKIGGIKLFYIIISLSLLNALIVIFLVYVYVRKKLEYQASYDSLTRLLNRYSYENEIEKEISRCKRYNRNMSLVLFDIDHFKDINDRHGHKRGDQVLSKLAKLVKKSVRQSDSVFRIGGEEFAIIIPETEADGASRMAEKIRREVESSSFQPVQQVTISLGVAELPGSTTHADLFRHADKALYQAKHGGRNRVEIFADDSKNN